MAKASPVLVRTSNFQNDLGLSPIFPEWIRSGRPEARMRELARSEDRTTALLIWDCTAGEFDWHYDQDETIIIVAGETYITADDGEQVLRPGDTAYFPAGSSCMWRIPLRVRKVAILRPSLPLPLSFSARAWGRMRALVRPQRGL
jgi:uncharacterized cupin superfamily protein